MKVSDYIAHYLRAREVPCVFELPGGMITHLLDALHRLGGVRVVTVHHEQAGAFAADAVGRLLGRPAVAMATVGPGAINLINGIGGAYLDSSPAVFITGQVQTYLQKGDRPIRQFGFQECDFVRMIEPLCKAAWRVRSPEEVPARLDEAFTAAVEGRPGPVVLDLPMDVQAREIEAEEVLAPASVPEPPPPPEGAAEEILAALEAAERPLILAGGGVRAAGARELLRRFAEAVEVPVVHSLMAVDTLPWEHPLRVGLIGMYGNRWANLAVVECDHILVLGSRLDPGLTSADVVSWKRGKRILQVDVDAGELGARVRGSGTIHADVGAVLRALLTDVEGRAPRRRPEWLARISALHQEWPDTAELEGCRGINPNAFVAELSAASREAAVFATDNGQHTWWSAQSVRLAPEQRFLLGSGLGAMGFSLPAGIGAAVATGRPAVVCVGDGAMQINIQELQTVVRERLPVKIVVFHNQCHGMVRQFQEGAFEGRYPGTVEGYDAPDFERVAAAYGVRARSLSAPEDIGAAVRWLWEEPAAPSLLQVHIAPETNVYPIVPFGWPITAMESFRPPGSDHE